MRSVEALVNLEARGTRGPAIFFESNQPNADATAAFAEAPRPVANSMSAAVYALLPNSTDVTVLRRSGLDVVNIALLDGLEDYHTPQDSLASFNTASLQHMGDMALSVTRKLASAPDRGETGSFDYTDIASPGECRCSEKAQRRRKILTRLRAMSSTKASRLHSGMLRPNSVQLTSAQSAVPCRTRRMISWKGSACIM